MLPLKTRKMKDVFYKQLEQAYGSLPAYDRINIGALKTPTTAQRFEEYITLKLNSIPENPDINSHWNACAGEIRKAASEVLGQHERTRPKGW